MALFNCSVESGGFHLLFYFLFHFLLTEKFNVHIKGVCIAFVTCIFYEVSDSMKVKN